MANTSPRHMPDGKYLAPLARICILLIDTATQEVPMKYIWKKLSVQFLRYAIELLYVKRRTRHKWR